MELLIFVKNRNHRYKYLVLFDGRFQKQVSENDMYIIRMFEFLVDNIIVVFAEKVFQQIVGILKGTNCTLF